MTGGPMTGGFGMDPPGPGGAVPSQAGAAGAEQDVRLPIFESVESDWFRRGKHAVDRAAPVPAADSGSAGWSSPGDAGWQAAEVAQAPVSGGYTGAGLPRRVPRANLVPGGVGAPAATLPVPARSAAQTRERLASFQQGIRKARAIAPEDDPYNDGGADGAT